MTTGEPATPPQAMPSGATPPSPATLEAELERARQQAEEYLNGWRRAKADYLNLKRETEERGAQVGRFAQAGYLEAFLPVWNNLQMALRHIPVEQEAREWVKGLRQVCQQFQQALTALGVVPIATVGEPFDPTQHEAVATVTRPDVAADIVAEEVSPGYTFHGQVLIPAKVKVAKQNS